MLPSKKYNGKLNGSSSHHRWFIDLLIDELNVVTKLPE